MSNWISDFLKYDHFLSKDSTKNISTSDVNFIFTPLVLTRSDMVVNPLSNKICIADESIIVNENYNNKKWYKDNFFNYNSNYMVVTDNGIWNVNNGVWKVYKYPVDIKREEIVMSPISNQLYTNNEPIITSDIDNIQNEEYYEQNYLGYGGKLLCVAETKILKIK